MNEPAEVIPIHRTCTCSPECILPIENKRRQMSNACAKRAIKQEKRLELAKLKETIAWQKKRIGEQIEIIALLQRDVMDLRKRLFFARALFEEMSNRGKEITR
jgi:hypothetical protein